MRTTLAAQLLKLDITAVDPTGDHIFANITGFVIKVLMVMVALVGAWKAFHVWMGEKEAEVKASRGDTGTLSSLRQVVYGVLVVEAILGGVLYLAAYGTSLLPTLIQGG